MESTLKFQRGDIYFIRLGSGTGSEQSGTALQSSCKTMWAMLFTDFDRCDFDK